MPPREFGEPCDGCGTVVPGIGLVPVACEDTTSLAAALAWAAGLVAVGPTPLLSALALFVRSGG